MNTVFDSMTQSLLLEECVSALPRDLAWQISLPALRATLRQELGAAFADLRNMARAEEFHAAVERSGTKPSDFLPRIVSLRGHPPALATILFRRHAVNSSLVPYVRVEFGADRIPLNAASLEPFARAFSVFAPTHVRVFRFRARSGGERFAAAAGADEEVFRCSAKTYLVAGRMPVCVDAAPEGEPPRWVSRRVRVEQASDLAFYPRYREIYADFHRVCPDLMEGVPLEDEDMFEAAIACGLVCTVLVDDRFAGIAAAFRRPEARLPGWYVAEKVLDPRHWGTGLGASLEWHFTRALLKAASTLPESPGPWLTGDVDVANASSLGSAARNGRFPIGAWCEVPFA